MQSKVFKHGQGWPLGTINEVGITQNGIGELRLLIPALRELQNISSGQRQIILIAPPKQPFAPALVKENIHLESISIVKTKTIKDSLWAAEQSRVYVLKLIAIRTANLRLIFSNNLNHGVGKNALYL